MPLLSKSGSSLHRQWTIKCCRMHPYWCLFIDKILSSGHNRVATVFKLKHEQCWKHKAIVGGKKDQIMNLINISEQNVYRRLVYFQHCMLKY